MLQKPIRFNARRIVTAGIRRMGEGNIFTLCVSPHLRGGVPHLRSGGVPHPRSGWGRVPHPRSGRGYPIPDLARGYPIPGLARGIIPHLDGVPPNQVWMGYPTWTWDGVPPPWTWDGVPPESGMGNPPQTWDGVPPNLGQGIP